jgi:hypothetical protein
MNTKVTKRCDVCGNATASQALSKFATKTEWWVCSLCFGKADRQAAEEDRSPNENDFERLKNAAASSVR